MESVEASLVSLGKLYGLVPRPLPKFIPSECIVTGEIRGFNRVADDANIEAEYEYSHKRAGWELKND